MDAITSLEFVMRSQSSRKVRAFTAFHMPAATPDSPEVSWQVRLPIADELLDESWRCWLRLRRRDAAPRDILVTVDAPDRLHEALVAPREDDTVVSLAAWAEAGGLELGPDANQRAWDGTPPRYGDVVDALLAA